MTQTGQTTHGKDSSVNRDIDYEATVLSFSTETISAHNTLESRMPAWCLVIIYLPE